MNPLFSTGHAPRGETEYEGTPGRFTALLLNVEDDEVCCIVGDWDDMVDRFDHREDVLSGAPAIAMALLIKGSRQMLRQRVKVLLRRMDTYRGCSDADLDAAAAEAVGSGVGRFGGLAWRQT